MQKDFKKIKEKQTDARAKLEAEIKKTDAEIDDLVYKIYDITDKERKIIEESLK
jgi:septal ring factor EnvC (AmiA/AmiB activator)